ncbi:hypothetical protein ACYPKM_04880 [Pseudomonas aeruginosa]
MMTALQFFAKSVLWLIRMAFRLGIFIGIPAWLSVSDGHLAMEWYSYTAWIASAFGAYFFYIRPMFTGVAQADVDEVALDVAEAVVTVAAAAAEAALD